MREQQQKYQEARPESLPRRVSPMLLTEPVKFPYEGKDYAFEPKLDGNRMIAISDKERVLIHTRGQMAVTERFPEIAKSLREIGRQFVLDGEMCALDENGIARRELLVKGAKRLVYYPFDILHIYGQNLMDIPYEERREILESEIPTTSNVIHVPSFQGNGSEVFNQIQALGYEGMVAKKLKSIYVPGVRSKSWLKIKPKSST